MQAVLTTTQAVEKNQKFQISCPLPKGRFFASQTFHLIAKDQQEIKCQLTPLQTWPDQSIKWLKCEGLFLGEQECGKTLYISEDKRPIEAKRKNWVLEKNNSLVIETADAIIKLNLLKFCSLDIGNLVSISCRAEFVKLETKLESLITEYEVAYDTQQRPLFCKITQNIDVVTANKILAKLTAIFCIYYEDGNVITDLTLHNIQAIIAHGGKWDLGNENSLYVKSLALLFDYKSSQQTIAIDETQPKQHYDYVQITQFSSGGENWNSDNHKTPKNKVELLNKGARGSVRLNEETTPFECLRPEPSLQVTLDKKAFCIQPKHFWQKYPCGISSSQKRTIVDFADQKSGCEVELQPGEIKAHTLAFGLDSNNLQKQLNLCQFISLDKKNVSESKAIPFINESLLQHPLNSILDKTDQDNKWLKKREALDEFGWRNFGDLYADHEAAEYQGDGIFVSHYNNQYDPLFGFLKLWILTGKPEFRTLADDLFNHIVNIDIYHTSLDKPEYNNGMFWHTDHYVQAETASHRTYSKHQESNVYADHAGGGGPGSHHCYSSGLALFYLLTGNQQAKSMTLGLGEWMQYIYEGDGTLLGLVARAKNANHLRVPFTNRLLLGHGTGVLRNIFNNKYPLDRGTGNNVNVLIDCFEITKKRAYLTQVEYVIVNTISQHDDISKREFKNIEDTWFYTVFLQAVLKYLLVAAQEELLTSTVSDIRASFIHYAKWMAENETYYLANKERLEYPNDTWTGQDLRKIHILLSAYEMTKESKMLKKANELIDYVYPSLLCSAEKDFTRIQALVMQNYTDLDTLSGNFDALKPLTKPDTVLAKQTLKKSYFERVSYFFSQYSVNREINLLCVRIPFFNRLFRK